MKTKNISNIAQLQVCAFGMGIGVAKALCLILLAWMAGIYSYDGPMIHSLMDFMPGYGPTFLGGIVGGIWGFIGGFFFGAIASSTYNCCARCVCKCCCNCPDCKCKNCCEKSKQ